MEQLIDNQPSFDELAASCCNMANIIASIRKLCDRTQPTSYNTGSLKFPSLEEVREAYERHVSGRTFSNEKPLDSIAFIREYIITACKLQAGA